MDRNERRAMLGNTVSPAFEEQTKLLGHVWERQGPKAQVVCKNCGAVSKAPDEKWKAACPNMVGAP